MRPLLLAATALCASASVCLADPLEWATPNQRDFVARLASAVASVEPCDADMNRDRLSAAIREAFGPNLSAKQTADVLYAVTTAEAIQGVQMRSLSPPAKRERCALFQKHFGPEGTDIRGVLK